MQKKIIIDLTGHLSLIKELEKNPSYNLINLFNFGILPNKPSSSGITVINKKND
jgi:hypothetical protein